MLSGIMKEEYWICFQQWQNCWAQCTNFQGNPLGATLYCELAREITSHICCIVKFSYYIGVTFIGISLFIHCIIIIEQRANSCIEFFACLQDL
jgi:hypothetical protein